MLGDVELGEKEFRLRDGARHALDQLDGLLDDAASGVPPKIACLEHVKSVGREVDHVYTPCSHPASGKSAL